MLTWLRKRNLTMLRLVLSLTECFPFILSICPSLRTLYQYCSQTDTQLLKPRLKQTNDDVFFVRRAIAVAVPGEEILIQQILAPSHNIAILSSSQNVRKLFIKLNTLLLASAAAERLLCCIDNK